MYLWDYAVLKVVVKDIATILEVTHQSAGPWDMVTTPPFLNHPDSLSHSPQKGSHQSLKPTKTWWHQDSLAPSAAGPINKVKDPNWYCTLCFFRANFSIKFSWAHFAANYRWLNHIIYKTLDTQALIWFQYLKKTRLCFTVKSIIHPRAFALKDIPDSCLAAVFSKIRFIPFGLKTLDCKGQLLWWNLSLEDSIILFINTHPTEGNALTVKGHWITHLCMDIRMEKQKVYFSVLMSLYLGKGWNTPAGVQCLACGHFIRFLSGFINSQQGGYETVLGCMWLSLCNCTKSCCVTIFI